MGELAINTIMGVGINSTKDLLSYASFRQWANGTVSKPDASKWDQWCKKNESNRRLAAKAQAELLGIAPALPVPGDSVHKWKLLYRQIKKIQQVTLA